MDHYALSKELNYKYMFNIFNLPVSQVTHESADATASNRMPGELTIYGLPTIIQC